MAQIINAQNKDLRASRQRHNYQRPGNNFTLAGLLRISQPENTLLQDYQTNDIRVSLI